VYFFETNEEIENFVKLHEMAIMAEDIDTFDKEHPKYASDFEEILETVEGINPDKQSYFEDWYMTTDSTAEKFVKEEELRRSDPAEYYGVKGTL
jgi:DNA phosphorothioation-dependent restriction protein DptG